MLVQTRICTQSWLHICTQTRMQQHPHLCILACTNTHTDTHQPHSCRGLQAQRPGAEPQHRISPWRSEQSPSLTRDDPSHAEQSPVLPAEPGPLPGTGTDGPCRGGGEALTDARRSRADRHFLTARQREEPRGPTDGQADARWSHPCPRSTHTVTQSPQSHVRTRERRHAAQGTRTPTDPRHTPAQVTVRTSPSGHREEMC